MRRLFWAIGINDEVRGAARAVREQVTDPALRWTPPENLHLTLKFLGDTDRDPEELARAAQRPCAGVGPLELAVGEVGSFGRPPRVIWLGLGGPGREALEALAAELDAAAVDLGFPPEARPFTPHLTLARVRRGERTQRPNGVRVPEASFRASDLLLLESRPGRPYRELARVSL